MVTLYAAGFNGHGQLICSSGSDLPQDLWQFEEIVSGGSIEVLRAGWSYTIIKQDETLRLRGFFFGRTCRDLILRPSFTIQGAFVCESPPHVGFISSEGKLYLLSDGDTSRENPQLVQQGDDDSPKVAFISVTNTGHTCVSFLQSPGSQLIHVLQFDSFPSFLTWFGEPSSSHRDKNYTHHSLRGRVAQLEAGAAHFILRTESGDLYSWTTDARHHRCLGRSVEKATPAEAPAPVEALGGIDIVKVAAGGWTTLALSKDRDAYVWGREQPQATPSANLVLPTPEEEVRLVDVAEGADITDIAVGAGHLLVLTADGMVLAFGANTNGQLSIAQEGQKEIDHVSDWTKTDIAADQKIERVWAGDCTSFALLVSA